MLECKCIIYPLNFRGVFRGVSRLPRNPLELAVTQLLLWSVLGQYWAELTSNSVCATKHTNFLVLYHWLSLCIVLFPSTGTSSFHVYWSVETFLSLIRHSLPKLCQVSLSYSILSFFPPPPSLAASPFPTYSTFPPFHSVTPPFPT